MIRPIPIKPLDTATTTFIEKFGQYMSELGLPPSMSRVLGLLLICEPHYRSAEVIQYQLKLSAGSVSSALLFLQKLGLIKRVTFPKDRHFYYEIADGCWQKMVETRRLQMEQGVALADEGLTISKGNERIKDMRRLYEQFGQFLGSLKV